MAFSVKVAMMDTMADRKRLAAKSLREADLDRREIKRLLEESEARVREFLRARRQASQREPEKESSSASARED